MDDLVNVVYIIQEIVDDCPGDVIYYGYFTDYKRATKYAEYLYERRMRDYTQRTEEYEEDLREYSKKVALAKSIDPSFEVRRPVHLYSPPSRPEVYYEVIELSPKKGD